MKISSDCLSENVPISPSFLKNISAGFKVLGCQVFFFCQPFKSFRYLTFISFSKKSIIILIIGVLCITCLFPLVARFPCYLQLQIDHVVSKGSLFVMFSPWSFGEILEGIFFKFMSWVVLQPFLWELQLFTDKYQMLDNSLYLCLQTLGSFSNLHHWHCIMALVQMLDSPPSMQFHANGLRKAVEGGPKWVLATLVEN